ncbi:MAG: type I 3-dehydroquinate dehydratase [Eubacteriales bacterium]|nr:type I 3-dehydroquinate dehydratase [Eubacteriales bacterium]
MRPTFLHHEKPLLAAMIESVGLRECLSDMRIAEHDGADALAVDLAMLDPACRQPKEMAQIIRATGLPLLFYTYRNYTLANADDDERAVLQLRAAELGAACCDVMGDLFDPNERQLTCDPAAVDKQKRLIVGLHEAGAEVIMSSHLKTPMSTASVLEQMQRMAERGADIAKLIAYADTPEQFAAAVDTTRILKEKLPIPFIHLCSGRFGPLHRYNAVLLGSLLTFSVPRYTERVLGVQPLTCDARRIMDDLLRHSVYPA